MTKYLVFLGLALASCTHKKNIPEGNIVYLQTGDSITFGEKNSPGNSPGDHAVRALATPATFIKLGFSGENLRDFTQKRRQQLQDSLRLIPDGRRIVLGIAYGANDVVLFPKEVVLANIVRTARWATDTLHIKEVLLIPTMNRLDKYNYTTEADGSISNHFNENRHWLNQQLSTLRLAGVHAAKASDSPAMFSDTAPTDITRFPDRVHPNDYGAKELGEGTIAHGIASFGGIKLK